MLARGDQTVMAVAGEYQRVVNGENLLENC